MFDWFNKKFSRRGYTNGDTVSDMEKIASDMNKVLPFPELKAVPSMSKIEPDTEKESAKVFYRLGVTDKNRVALSMGLYEITMTKTGVQNLIDQLELFQGQLQNEEEDE
jgi:hypothetical protein